MPGLGNVDQTQFNALNAQYTQALTLAFLDIAIISVQLSCGSTWKRPPSERPRAPRPPCECRTVGSGPLSTPERSDGASRLPCRGGGSVACPAGAKSADAAAFNDQAQPLWCRARRLLPREPVCVYMYLNSYT